MINVKLHIPASAVAPAAESAIRSLALPGLHDDNEVFVTKSNDTSPPRKKTTPTTCGPQPENTMVDQFFGTASAKIKGQGYFRPTAIARQLSNQKSPKETAASHISDSETPCRSSDGVAHISLPRGMPCPRTCERPTVVDEQKDYWVVKKPLCHLPWSKERTGTSIDDDGGVACAESLASFLQSEHPEQHFPLLSSRQHNFGVIFHLDDSWIGLNIVAKSEAAYASFQTLLELQLIHSYVECFVLGPPLLSATELYGTTATGSAKLCVKVLQSTVCRSAGCGEIGHYSVNSAATACSTATVVSHVIFRISFPPILLPDVLWCSGIAVASNPYVRTALDGVGQRCETLCCFALTLPQIKIDIPRGGFEPQQQLGGSCLSTAHCEYTKKQHFQIFSSGGKVDALNLQLHYSTR